MASRKDRINALSEPERTKRVIAEHRFTEVDDDYFDRLLAALDEPARPLPALAHAARRAADQPAFDRC